MFCEGEGVTKGSGEFVVRAGVLLLAGLFFAAPCAAGCALEDPQAPRTLVVAVDGIPLSLIQQARELGAFAEWPEPVPLVSTFPSVTNIAFTAMFQPFDIAPARGYEVKFYDLRYNKVFGGSPKGYADRLFAWRDVFDVTGRSVGGKLAIYTGPLGAARDELEEGEKVLFSSDEELLFVHVGATDAALHLKGYPRIVEFLVELDAWLRQLVARHRKELGRELRLVLLSDHGNTDEKVRRVSGIRTALRDVGFEPREHLIDPPDIVAVTFGIVSYGALFLAEPERAEVASRAVAGVEGVDFATWRAGDTLVRVVSTRGDADIEWQDRSDGRYYRYRDTGDPLEFGASREALDAEGKLDGEGFAHGDDWLVASIDSPYPGALRRLVEAGTAEFVTNHATVLLSTLPGYAWGLRSAHWSSRLAGGKLEGTHGALDRASSLGFLLTNDPGLIDRPAYHAADVLLPFAATGVCLQAQRRDGGEVGHPNGM
jgi:hypothetical protein